MFESLKSNRIAEVLLLLNLITLPLAEHWSSKALLITLLFVLYGFYRKYKIEFPKMGLLYILIFIFVGFSYFWSANKSNTLLGIVSLLPFLLFTIAYKQIIAITSLKRILRITAFVFLFYGFLMIILAFVRFLKISDYETFYYHALTEPFKANAIYIALIYGQLYLFLLYQLLFVSTKNRSIDYILVISLFTFQLLLSSKLIFSILIFISIIFFLYYIRNKGVSIRKLLLGSVIGTSLFLLIVISTFTKNRFKEIADVKQIENVFTQNYFGPGYYLNGLTLRLFQLRCLYEIEKEKDFNSFLGTGFKASQPLLNQKYAQYDLYRGPIGEGENDGYFVFNFHNQYAQFLIELGIFGLIIILLMFHFLMINPLINKNILLFGVGFLFLSFALTESYLLRQKGVVSFVLFSLLAEQYISKAVKKVLEKELN